MKFFTSDHHFYHNNIIKFCERPFKDVDHMNEVMIARWNERVQPTDTVYYIGDFSMSMSAMEKITPRLNGRKIMIPGNHDECHHIHKSTTALDRYRAAGWEIDDEARRLWIGPHNMVLCHFPYLKEGEEYVRYTELRPFDAGEFLIHGHVHCQWKVKGKMINVGADVWDFYPVSEDEVLEIASRA